MKRTYLIILWTLTLTGTFSCQNVEDVTQSADRNTGYSDSVKSDSQSSVTAVPPSVNDSDDSETVDHSGAIETESDSGPISTRIVNDESPDAEFIDPEKTPAQNQSLTFIISNQTSDSVALPAQHGIMDVLNCRDADGVSYYLAAPYCVPACDTVSPDNDCQMHCDTSSNALEIGSNQKQEVRWDGHFRTIQHNYCADGGACYNVHPPAAGDYEFSIQAYPNFVCVLMSGVCYWTDSHIYSGGMVSGPETVFSTAVSLPAAEENIEIIIDQLQ